MLRKIIIVPWFGKYPEWLNRWVSNFESLDTYTYKIFSNLDLFKRRIKQCLGVEAKILSGTGKPWDFRPMFAELFKEEIKGYDFWGHTDFDVVYGDVNRFITDDVLNNCDIFSCDTDAICGPWTLYRNTDIVNNMYKKIPNWRKLLETEKCFGLEEGAFSSVVSDSILRLHGAYNLQGLDDEANYTLRNGRLYMNNNEVMIRHFRHTKIYPC